MRIVSFCFVAAALLLFEPATAQTPTAPASNKPATAAKARRVWDNDSIQQIQGGINVVGSAPVEKLGSPGNPKPTTDRPPGVAFRATTIDGDLVTSDGLYGKTVLVQYWATWCPHCQADQAPVDRIARSFASEGVVVLAVTDESEATVKNYLTSNPRQCPIILGKDSNFKSLASVTGFPTYIVIDANGQIAAKASGEQGEQRLRKLLARAGVTSN